MNLARQAMGNGAVAGAANVGRDALGNPPLAAALDGVLTDFASLPGADPIAALNGAQLLLERMLCTGARFRDSCSPGGSCRFLTAEDGTLAVNLPRPSDWELLPAWLARISHQLPAADADALATKSGDGCGLETDAENHWTWRRVAAVVRKRSRRVLLDRARLLGLAVAAPGAAASTFNAGRVHRRSQQAVSDICRLENAPHLQEVGQLGEELYDPHSDCGDESIAHRIRRNQSGPRSHRPLVIDLSALWAGPLCANLLWLCGARVVKVESADRPDGAREGDPAFHALLNQGKESVVLDFRAESGRRMLRRLLERADIVIESSRPRALRHLGIAAEDWVRSQDGRTWIGITGYGRDEPAGNWVAFGDDAGVAAGLADLMYAATGAFQFAGDAIADPLTGVRAARAAWRSWLAGGSRVVSISLAGTAARMLAREIDRLGTAELIRTAGHWWQAVQDGQITAGIERRSPKACAPAYGADTEAVLRELHRHRPPSSTC